MMCEEWRSSVVGQYTKGCLVAERLTVATAQLLFTNGQQFKLRCENSPREVDFQCSQNVLFGDSGGYDS
jgi:hypothetical protein